MKRIVFLILVVANVSAFANTVDKTLEVKEFIKQYTTGTYTADTKKLRDVFHEKALMTGYLPNEYVLGTVDHFLKDLGSRPSMKSQKVNYISTITYINVQGNVASVTLEEDNFFGKAKIVNYLSLVKIDGVWKIVSKVFTFKK